MLGEFSDQAGKIPEDLSHNVGRRLSTWAERWDGFFACAGQLPIQVGAVARKMRLTAPYWMCPTSAAS